MLKRIFLLSFIVATASITTVWSKPGPIIETADRVAAPPLLLRDAWGAKVRLSDYRGQVVLLNFWATWCEPCNIEIPWFVAFEKAFHGDGFATVGISVDEDGWHDVKPYVRAHHVNYRILLGSNEMARDYSAIDALPTTLLIDRKGRIAARHVGLVAKATYEAQIAWLIREPKSAAAGISR